MKSKSLNPLCSLLQGFADTLVWRRFFALTWHFGLAESTRNRAWITDSTLAVSTHLLWLIDRFYAFYAGISRCGWAVGVITALDQYPPVLVTAYMEPFHDRHNGATL